MNSTVDDLSHPLASHRSGPRLPAAARLFLSLLQRLDVGTLTFTSPAGLTRVYRGRRDGPAADLRLADWGVAAEILKSAEIGLAECHRDGRVETSDLTAFLMLCLANEAALADVFYGKPWVAFLLRVKHFLRSNTRANARRNIAAHYDLSNDFYALWLDETMSYSSAIFTAENQSMRDAQEAKYERVLAELAPSPGQHILEVGCGWGGFAEYAHRTRGVRITGITLSAAQRDFAIARMRRAGMEGAVDIRLVDYRDVTGQFDHIVSIEMFEAVGERYWPRYFQCLHDRLKPGGRAVIQSITIADAQFARYRATSDFIREYIFPGGMLAPVPRIAAEAARAGLVAGEPFRFGRDYAATLRWWLARVNAAEDRIKALGFDEAFLKLWRFYLCYCEAGFMSGRTDVIQMRFTRPA